MKTRTIQTIGNIVLALLAIGTVIILGIDAGQRAEARLAARLAK